METSMKTIRGPAIFLAQFAGDTPPFNSLAWRLYPFGVPFVPTSTSLRLLVSMVHQHVTAGQYRGKGIQLRWTEGVRYLAGESRF